MTYEAELAKYPDEFETMREEPGVVESEWPRSWDDVKDFCKQYLEGYPDDDVNTKKKRTRWVRTCAQKSSTDDECIAEMAKLMGEVKEPEPEPAPAPAPAGKGDKGAAA